MLHVTLEIARGTEQGKSDRQKLAKHVGGVRKYGRKTPIPLTVVLDVLGLNTALWWLEHTLEDSARIDRLLAADYAEHMLKHFEEGCQKAVGRLKELIEAARRFARGEILEPEIEAVRSEVHECLTGPPGNPDSFEAAIGATMCCSSPDGMAAAAWTAGQGSLAINFKTDENGWSRKSYEERRDDCKSACDAERRWQEERLREYLAAHLDEPEKPNTEDE